MKLIKMMIGIFFLIILSGCALKDRVIVSTEEAGEVEVTESLRKWIEEEMAKDAAMTKALPLFSKVWSIGEEVPVYDFYEDENNLDEDYLGEWFQKGYFKVDKAIYYDHLEESGFNEDFETSLQYGAYDPYNEEYVPVTFMSDVKDPAYVILDIEVEAFDLEEKYKQDPHALLYEFYCGSFHICHLNDEGEQLAYYSTPSYVYHETDFREKDYFSLKLEPNQKIATRIGFVIDKDATPIEDLYLGYELGGYMAYIKIDWTKGEGQ